MHPATATTPFTVLWALEKNEEDPPFLSFGAAPRARTQPPHRAPTPAPAAQRTELDLGRTRAHDAARHASMPTDDSNETPRAFFAASDFLVTNLRPDLLD